MSLTKLTLYWHGFFTIVQKTVSEITKIELTSLILRESIYFREISRKYRAMGSYRFYFQIMNMCPIAS